jgi:pimeloyl-ACP methyl ester carboxylesterase
MKRRFPLCSRRQIEQNGVMTRLAHFAPQYVACISLVLCTSALAQEIPSAATSDPARDKEFPATMEAPDVPSHGARLNAVLYVASGAGPHPSALLMHGFPGNEQNMDLAYAIRRAGWNVLVPHYRGSWGSAGLFSFTNALEDTQAAIQFLRDPENAKNYRSESKRIVLVGHSMGGFLVSYVAAHDPDIAGVAMISAWNLGASMSRPPDERRSETFRTASPRLAGTTPDGLMSEARQNAAKWNYLDYVGALKTRPVLIVESHDGNVSDNKALAEALRKAGDPQVAEADHVYSDHRMALQAAVLDWLQHFETKASK